MALSLEVVAKHAHVTVPSVRRARRDLRVAEATRVLIELRLPRDAAVLARRVVLPPRNVEQLPGRLRQLIVDLPTSALPESPSSRSSPSESLKPQSHSNSRNS